jgi:hypothetical protein
MGAQASTSSVLLPGAPIDNEVRYAIRLDAEQSLTLYGLMRPKRTLTWRDVLENSRMTLAVCVRAGLPPERLHRLQPDIKEWIRNDRATVDDCKHLGPWRPHPFHDLGCKSIGDLVLYRDEIPPRLLIDAGITVPQLRARYGLNAELMIMLRYSLDDWLALGLDEEALGQADDAQWARLFGTIARAEVRSAILLLLCKEKTHHS